ncbi:MAG: reverse transcriptase domain-containing protein, partial [Bacteroidota bacterium]
MSTGRNHQHKRYFRHLYAAYASAVDENLADLHKRLRHGSYEPQEPTRIFLPKPSGLQRPITLLSIEDQVVLQTIANLLARRLGLRRREVELKTVYSNVLDPNQESIFFVKDWHLTYNAFTKKIQFLYRQGFHWIAAFDLAAYYDTISHDLLLRTAFPRGGLGELSEVVLSWFRVWSSETPATSHAHGIPQGPIASDFLAECFLLPVDESLASKHVYVRYVDDIRLFGRSETEVQRAAIELEVQCRNRGLIPQAKKFVITKAKSLDEALSVIPS